MMDNRKYMLLLTRLPDTIHYLHKGDNCTLCERKNSITCRSFSHRIYNLMLISETLYYSFQEMRNENSVLITISDLFCTTIKADSYLPVLRES